MKHFRRVLLLLFIILLVYLISSILPYYPAPYLFLKALEERDEDALMSLVTERARLQAFLTNLGVKAVYNVESYSLGFLSERNRVPAEVELENRITGEIIVIKVEFIVLPASLFSWCPGKIDGLRLEDRVE